VSAGASGADLALRITRRQPLDWPLRAALTYDVVAIVGAWGLGFFG